MIHTSKNYHHNINITLKYHAFSILGSDGRLEYPKWTRVSHVLENRSGTWVHEIKGD